MELTSEKIGEMVFRAQVTDLDTIFNSLTKVGAKLVKIIKLIYTEKGL